MDNLSPESIIVSLILSLISSRPDMIYAKKVIRGTV